MAYLITANDKPSIDFSPENVVAEVIQNVRTILSTIKYEIPLDRQFGMDGSVIDMPIQQAQAKWSAEIFSQVKQYEPRAIIESISFEGSIEGKLVPTVEVRINETG
jgi:phage baseplate assembly protein W